MTNLDSPRGALEQVSGSSQRRIRRWHASTGWWCMVVAVVHVATTGLFYGQSLHELASGPVLGALDANPQYPAERGAAFWYAAAGVLLAGFGWSTWRLEATGRPPTGAFAASLSVLGLIGIIVSPLSGFWLILGIGLVAALRRRFAQGG